MPELHRYMAWDADYYDSKSRLWPHDHEVHGPFFAADEQDLKAQIQRAGLRLSDVRWEPTETADDEQPVIEHRNKARA